MRSTRILLGFLGVFIANGLLSVDARSSVKFGDELLLRGQFVNASFEYQRALSDQPEIPDSISIELLDKALQSMWLSREYKACADLGEFYSRKFKNHRNLNCIAEYYQGLSYYGLKAYPRAAIELSQSHGDCPEPYNSRSLYWSGLGLFRIGDYPGARRSFESVPGISEKRSDALQAINAVAVAERLPRKSPRKAGFLNLVVPGAGYAYAGYPQTGAISFLTNGLFAWGTVVAVQRGETALAIILGSINVAWYFGGVQGAANAAARTNESRVNAVIRPLEIN